MKKARSPALIFLVVVLALSGLGRLGVLSGPALAERAAPDPAVADAPTDEDISAVLQALQEREQQLQEREASLEERLVLLEVAEETIAERLEELRAAEASLAESIATAETANDSDIDALVRVYESMKAEEAIPLFAAMPPEFAAGFILRMQPETSGPILAGLDPALAFSISAIIAGQNANVPTQ